jgi:hypothetical protein
MEVFRNIPREDLKRRFRPRLEEVVPSKRDFIR